jgi:hypothetical protein
MASNARLTAQGIRDLNYYGPRKVNPAAVVAPEPKPETDSPVAELPVELTAPDAVAS